MILAGCVMWPVSAGQQSGDWGSPQPPFCLFPQVKALATVFLRFGGISPRRPRIANPQNGR